MNGHPGASELTRRMTALAALPEGARILDIGAGAGETVTLLRTLGFDAEGIDLAPRAACVRQGDFLHTRYPDGSFDAAISECAFYVSGDVPGALREAGRLLRPCGLLLLSDVFFTDPKELLSASGFSLLYAENLTEQWKEYYIDALWRGEEPCCELPSGRCSYWLLIAKKEEKNGPV